ncbi:MAG TPA: spermine synthase, partial [Caldilinea sp.]|nr:spermine synthase [Caldilinea sp.]
SFDAIIHDPPMFSLAGELYSLAFYRELLRVLRRGGRLFHYIGNPESKSGATVTRGVVRRLTEAGFRRVQERAQAFGVVAVK